MSLTDIAKHFKDLKLTSRPGELYSYQNAIFALSGKMVQKATGETIQQALKEKIFFPLGMTKSLLKVRKFTLNTHFTGFKFLFPSPEDHIHSSIFKFRSGISLCVLTF